MRGSGFHLLTCHRMPGRRYAQPRGPPLANGVEATESVCGISKLILFCHRDGSRPQNHQGMVLWHTDDKGGSLCDLPTNSHVVLLLRLLFFEERDAEEPLDRALL